MAPATASQVISLGVSRGQFLGEARETGRFEHGRLIEPKVRKDGELVAVSWGEALAAAAAGLEGAEKVGGPGAVGVIVLVGAIGLRAWTVAIVVLPLVTPWVAGAIVGARWRNPAT